jgi:predicted RNA-binding Zn-ribbon protein involved in translation (DUF1610 family)
MRDQGLSLLALGLAACASAGAPSPPTLLPNPETGVSAQCPLCGEVVEGSATLQAHFERCQPVAEAQGSSWPPREAPIRDGGAGVADDLPWPVAALATGLYPSLSHSADLYVTTALPTLSGRNLETLAVSWLSSEFGLAREIASALLEVDLPVGCEHSLESTGLSPALQSMLGLVDVCGWSLLRGLQEVQFACPRHHGKLCRLRGMNPTRLNSVLVHGLQLRHHIAACWGARSLAHLRGQGPSPSYTPPRSLLPELKQGVQPLHCAGDQGPEWAATLATGRLYWGAVHSRCHSAGTTPRPVVEPEALWRACTILPSVPTLGSPAADAWGPGWGRWGGLLHLDSPVMTRLRRRQQPPLALTVSNDSVVLLFDAPILLPAHGLGPGVLSSMVDELGLEWEAGDVPEPCPPRAVSCEDPASPTAERVPYFFGAGNLDVVRGRIRAAPPQLAVRHHESPVLSKDRASLAAAIPGFYHLTALTPHMHISSMHSFDPGRLIALSGERRYLCTQVGCDVGRGAWGVRMLCPVF